MRKTGHVYCPPKAYSLVGVGDEANKKVECAVSKMLWKQIIKNNNNKAIKKTNQNASVTIYPTQTLSV